MMKQRQLKKAGRLRAWSLWRLPVVAALALPLFTLSACASGGNGSSTSDAALEVNDAQAEQVEEPVVEELAVLSDDQIELAREALDSVVSRIQAGDAQLAQEYLSSVWFDPQDYGVSYAAFASAYFDGMEYSLGDVSVQSDGSATVDATFSVKQMSMTLDVLLQARDEALAQGASTTEANYADEAWTRLASEQEWAVDQLHMDVGMVEGEDGAWSVQDPKTLAVVFLDGYDPRQAG